jgi:hypothetical protein
MQVFMGQSWADHNRDFMARAIRADRITFADMGVVRRLEREWDVERESPEAMAFVRMFQSVARRMAS